MVTGKIREQKGRPIWTEREREQRKGRLVLAGRAAGSGDEKASVGEGYVGVPGIL